MDTTAGGILDGADRRRRRWVLAVVLGALLVVGLTLSALPSLETVLCQPIAIVTSPGPDGTGQGEAIDCMQVCSYRHRIDSYPDWLVALRWPEAQEIVSAGAACP